MADEKNFRIFKLRKTEPKRYRKVRTDTSTMESKEETTMDRDNCIRQRVDGIPGYRGRTGEEEKTPQGRTETRSR